LGWKTDGEEFLRIIRLVRLRAGKEDGLLVRLVRMMRLEGMEGWLGC